MAITLTDVQDQSKKTLDQNICRNVLVVTITPRKENREVDLEGVAKNVKF